MRSVSVIPFLSPVHCYCILSSQLILLLPMLDWPLITPQAELADVIKANDEVLFVDGICLLDAIASPAAVGTYECDECILLC